MSADAKATDLKNMEEQPLKQDGPSEKDKQDIKERQQGKMGSALDCLRQSNAYLLIAVRCFLKYGVKPMICIFMLYVWVIKKLYWIYTLLPNNVLQMVFGAALCFFGGVYFASIAAVEAALNLGGPDMWEHLRCCWAQGALAGTASLKDDEVDADNNGIRDVQEMSMNELITHKAKVAMCAVEDPQRLELAMTALFNVWVAVLATLKFQFAKYVAIALGVAGMLSLPMARVFGPLLAYAMGPELHHWIPTIIDTTVKIIACIVVGFITAVISAFYSGLRGGRLFAEAVINILTEKGCMDKLPDSLASKPFDPDKSYIDECIAYPLAAAGFYWQFIHGFITVLPFPFSIALFPLDVIEWFLRFEIFFG